MTQRLSRLAASAIRTFLRWERWILLGCAVAFLASLAILLVRFYRESTLLVPTTGGTYIEGSVGDLQPLNPWFTITNDVNRDIVSLVFAGLVKFNPQTKNIEDDLATLEVSGDGKIYTTRLKENLFWHDSTEEDPHPVTADDVLFTFATMQDAAFPSGLLRQNFKGVSIEKINDRTVQFRLPQPYSFFSSNLTLGLLPKRAFEGVDVKNLDQTLDFGFNPVGSGPYRLRSIVTTDLSTEVTLERVERPLEPVFRLERIVFRIFPDYATLLSDIRNLDGIRIVPFTEQGNPAIPRRFVALDYTLPQYVALFLNLDRELLQDQKLRLGLRLGTNKQEITDAIGESIIIDTPLMEIDQSDWRYKFDADAAQGALFESEWYFPEKIRLQRLLEQREANSVGALKLPHVLLLDTGAVLSFTGSSAGVPQNAAVNGVRITSHPSASGTWIVALPTVAGTGAVKLGTNLIKLTDEKGKILDSAYLWRTTDRRAFQRAKEEQSLIDAFLRSRARDTATESVTVRDFFLDGDFLRRRVSTDPVGVRVNDRGQRLAVTLLTSSSPPKYREVAEIIRDQWAQLGVQVTIDIPETRAEFEEKMLKREYDVLLFGQSLLDNLDSYPYWHASGVQKLTGKRADLRLDAYNLAQYASFEADALLETIRTTTNEAERAGALKKLSDVLNRDVPAIVLYSPEYTYAHREDLQGVELGHLSMHSDRFLTLHRWYVKERRIFQAGKGWLSFFGWLSSFLLTDSTEQGV